LARKVDADRSPERRTFAFAFAIFGMIDNETNYPNLLAL
jgi:hypothetical protein